MEEKVEKTTLIEAWKAYVEIARGHYGEETEEIIEEADIAYLKSIGAADELIEAASSLPSINNVYLAPSAEMREYAPDCFANSLIVGDDGTGNFMCWMDVTEANSKILYLCHDPGVVMVIANSAVEWLEGLVQGFQSPTFDKMEESDWGNFFETSGLEKRESEIWKTNFYNGKTGELGLKHWQENGLSYFDFADAQVGTGFSLCFNGKYSVLEVGKQTGVVVMGVLSQEEVRLERRDDIMIYTLMALFFASCFYYFNQIVGKSIISSLFSSAASTAFFFFVAGMLYIWFDQLMDWLKAKK